ncbi:hypothetical protein PTE30175_02536 [Pandoraea terrae]|uniref:Tyr recombinase domain-containing protein n=1 Tax=Pandoraea terrae TaxID=1537710 RepID=A0A5E4VHM0_9BURK|nr:site-specific integrase [Pandoraea terrae]VVE10515.1 hypothetical protein PTE30175_02536 [Pandoraea terrae]
MGDAHRHLIRSRQTAVVYEDCVSNFLAFRSTGKVPAEGPFLRAEADEFLFLNSLVWQQKTLDQHRQALNKVLCIELPRYRASVPTFVRSRAYTNDEINLIVSQMSQRHALSARLISATGMRAFELLSLSDVDKCSPSPDRPWRSDLFSGLTNFVRCTTVGKGGLARSVAIPKVMYEEINQLRFVWPTIVSDRRKSYTPTFDLAAGQALSLAFTRASQKALGFSFGIHGLRHSYVQRRLNELQGQGFTFLESLEVCAQEVGHFRKDITLHYTTVRG